MTQNKIDIVFIVENVLGGVAYFNKNIIDNTSLRDQFNIKLIWVDHTESVRPRFKDTVNADEVVYFSYSGYENKFSVLQRLHTLLGKEPGALVCNDGLEMETIYMFGTNKTVFQVVHDFYNIRLAVKYGAITDAFVTHTLLFADVLTSADPANISAFHLRHGVTIPILEERTPSSKIRIVFTGRLEESKGVKDLWLIDEGLKDQGMEVEWTIIGRGPLEKTLREQWLDKRNVQFVSPDTNAEVIRIMSNHDLFVLPTTFEGSPVSILEALSVGIVPIVSDLPGGIREVVNEKVGIRVQIGSTAQFVEAIVSLVKDRGALKKMSIEARLLAESLYNVKQTSDLYFQAFSRFKSLKKKTQLLPKIKVGFRLDQNWIPNSIVKVIRKNLA